MALPVKLAAASRAGTIAERVDARQGPPAGSQQVRLQPCCCSVQGGTVWAAVGVHIAIRVSLMKPEATGISVAPHTHGFVVGAVRILKVHHGVRTIGACYREL